MMSHDSGADLDATAGTSYDTSYDTGAGDDLSVDTTDWTAEDLDGDGSADAFMHVLGADGWEAVVDTDGDSLADTYAVDADGDGVPEATVVRNGDGTYTVSIDTDGDGVADSESTLTRDEIEAAVPDLVAMLDLRFDGSEGSEGSEGTDPTFTGDPVDPSTDEQWVQDGQLVGDPTGDSEHWFEQGFNGSCVPASVTQIVAEYTGTDPANENEFIQMANDMGLWIVGPDGVPGIGVEGAVEMLNGSGIPAELTYSSMDELAGYLDDGRGVICYIDSGEIWYGDETVEDNTIDHAVVVTGIDYDRGVVIISDTGDPNGNMAEYPIEQFADAWADGGNSVVVCDSPPADEVAGASTDAAVGNAVDGPWVLVPVFLKGAASL